MSPLKSQAISIRDADGIDSAIIPVVRKIPEPIMIQIKIMLESKSSSCLIRLISSFIGIMRIVHRKSSFLLSCVNEYHTF